MKVMKVGRREEEEEEEENVKSSLGSRSLKTLQSSLDGWMDGWRRHKRWLKGCGEGSD